MGIRHDATFGPVVTFGLGGAFAEAIDDVATRVTPLTDRDAADLVRSARAWSVLADSIYALDALEDLLLRVGLLADLMPEVVELAMNPVLDLDRGGDRGRPDDQSRARTVRPRRPAAADAQGSRGRPSTRSPMMLRSTFEVPPMIVYAGE